MKRNILIMVVFAALSAHAFGQGIVIFSATADKIRYTTGGATIFSVPTNSPATIPGYGTLHIALYSASAGTVLTAFVDGLPNLSGPWAIQTSPLIQNIVPLPGAVPGVNVTLDASSGAPGSDVELEVVYWTGSFSTFAQAAEGGGQIAWSGSAASGGAFGWEQKSGTTTSPAVVLKGSGGFDGLLNEVPEPSALALGGLGAAALLLFRRRK